MTAETDPEKGARERVELERFRMVCQYFSRAEVRRHDEAKAVHMV